MEASSRSRSAVGRLDRAREGHDGHRLADGADLVGERVRDGW